VSQVVRTLEGRMILQRRRHPDDSRAHAVTLSDLGLALAGSSTAVARRLNAEFFARTDGAALAGLLETLTNAI
jgi:DNA-binding MarR family transcriptional regulator